MNEIERIIRRMSPEELAAWLAIGGWLPKGQLAAGLRRRDPICDTKPANLSQCRGRHCISTEPHSNKKAAMDRDLTRAKRSHT